MNYKIPTFISKSIMGQQSIEECMDRWLSIGGKKFKRQRPSLVGQKRKPHKKKFFCFRKEGDSKMDV